MAAAMEPKRVVYASWNRMAAAAARAEKPSARLQHVGANKRQDETAHVGRGVSLGGVVVGVSKAESSRSKQEEVEGRGGVAL